MLICILTKNVITSCSVTMMLFLHLEAKPLMTLTTVLYLSCALISGHLAMMLMELTKRRYASFLVVFNRPINILCRVSLFLSMALCLLLRSEERFSRNAETDLVCRLLLEKKKNEKGLAQAVAQPYRQVLSAAQSHRRQELETMSPLPYVAA